MSFHRTLWFRIAASAGLIAVLAWRIDLSEALETLADANYAYALAALPVYSLSKLVDSYRWRLMLARVGPAPVMGLYGTFLVSNFANNVLPLRVGDAIRVQVPARRWGLPRAGLTATVFVTESLLDGVAFAVLLLFALAFLDLPRVLTGLTWGLVGVVAVGVILGVAFSRLRPQPRWEERGLAAKLPGGLRRRLARWLPEFLEGLAVLRDWPLAGPALVATFASWLLEAAMFWLFGLTFGLELGLADYIVIVVTANMIVAMPIAPSNIGPYEVAMTEVAVLLGVDSAQAGGFAIGSHLLNILWVAVGGVIALWLMRLRVEDVFFLRTGREGELGQEEEVEEEAPA